MYHYDSRRYPYMGTVPYSIYPIPFMPRYPILSRAYVPYPKDYNKYPLAMALIRGTLFPELYRPYVEKDRRRKGVW